MQKATFRGGSAFWIPFICSPQEAGNLSSKDQNIHPPHETLTSTSLHINTHTHTHTCQFDAHLANNMLH